MLRHLIPGAAVLAACFTIPPAVAAEPVTVKPVLAEKLPNLPGQSVTMVRVTIAPGAAPKPHRHAGSVAVYVLSGEIRSRVDTKDGSGTARVYRAGETFFEPEGAVHAVSENPSASQPAELLAVFIAPTGATLTREAK